LTGPLVRGARYVPVSFVRFIVSKKLEPARLVALRTKQNNVGRNEGAYYALDNPAIMIGLANTLFILSFDNGDSALLFNFQ
jgi:hypothetical protein